MDAATPPTAKASRRNWIIIAFVALGLAAMIALLCRPSRPAVVITGTHLGGNVFSLTNHTDEALLVNVLIEVQTNGQWVVRPQGRANTFLAPHDSRTSFFSGNGGPVVPTQPWRLHGMAAKELHGLAARWQMLSVYVEMRRHGRRPLFNPFVSNDRVTEDAGEFFAYPLTEPTRK